MHTSLVSVKSYDAILNMIITSTKITNIYCGELWIKQHFSAEIYQWKEQEHLVVYQN
jgi:hypothetical protein